MVPFFTCSSRSAPSVSFVSVFCLRLFSSHHSSAESVEYGPSIGGAQSNPTFTFYFAPSISSFLPARDSPCRPSSQSRQVRSRLFWILQKRCIRRELDHRIKHFACSLVRHLFGMDINSVSSHLYRKCSDPNDAIYLCACPLLSSPVLFSSYCKMNFLSPPSSATQSNFTKF